MKKSKVGIDLRTVVFYVFASLFVGLGAAWADISITVNNPSFEIIPGGTTAPTGLPLANSAPHGASYTDAAIPDWTTTGAFAAGQFDPNPIGGGLYFNYVPDGLIIAYSDGDTLSQTVGTTVTPGAVYTLSVYLGNRGDDTSLDNLGSADLLINGVKYLATGTEASPGNWSLWTATYTGKAADAGDSITIELNGSPNTGSEVGEGQGDFDNVSLSYVPTTTTPEPKFYGVLLTVGLGCLICLDRLRRSKRLS